MVSAPDQQSQMPPSNNPLPSRTSALLISVAIVLLLPALLIFFPPDGGERATWAQFIGRFHLLAVHLPIALIVLVPVLELMGRNIRYAYLRASAPFVLLLAFVAAIVSSILGWCLARSGGYSGPLVTQHMWGAASLVTLSWLCCVVRERAARFAILYPMALTASLALVAWTGYRGGQISQGENHLTEFMPQPLRKVLGVPANSVSQTAVNDGTFYSARIQPIFASQCLPCHGREKRKGGLQLDSYTALMRGGKDGAAIRAGDARGSDLYHRVTLSPSDDNFMPKGERPPLSDDQIKLIELWIANGASNTAKVDSIKDAPSGSGPVVRADITFEKPDMAAVGRARDEIASALTSLQQRFPNLVNYESRASADLVLNASLLGGGFKDNDLEAFAPVASHIVVADLSRTGITDQSAPFMTAMKRLRVLRLAHTAITDRTLQSLAGLDQLSSLSVFDTRVTTAALPALEKMHNLRTCYAGQTAISGHDPLPSNITAKLVF
jgi:uncharacterized membrane protein